eukprot:CAMPEP_0118664708 /NCGR_PEP_ID=MMETSP0785-20121206/18180_1 /TAXON_ID=91992 /ORGANISM="Bolidomonas pacifica, Strain CCMP 1866" /LENGTH=136 /DNA_ID=CAMNT_0006558679 /DNA_START=97 /DNA_END=504 /DNA_ORIENTATION=+
MMTETRNPSYEPTGKVFGKVLGKVLGKELALSLTTVQQRGYYVGKPKGEGPSICQRGRRGKGDEGGERFRMASEDVSHSSLATKAPTNLLNHNVSVTKTQDSDLAVAHNVGLEKTSDWKREKGLTWARADHSRHTG